MKTWGAAARRCRRRRGLVSEVDRAAQLVYRAECFRAPAIGRMAEWQLPGPANIGRLAELLSRLRRQTVVNALLGSVLGPYLALKNDIDVKPSKSTTIHEQSMLRGVTLP